MWEAESTLSHRHARQQINRRGGGEISKAKNRLCIARALCVETFNKVPSHSLSAYLIFLLLLSDENIVLRQRALWPTHNKT